MISRPVHFAHLSCQTGVRHRARRLHPGGHPLGGCGHDGVSAIHRACGGHACAVLYLHMPRRGAHPHAPPPVKLSAACSVPRPSGTSCYNRWPMRTCRRCSPRPPVWSAFRPPLLPPSSPRPSGIRCLRKSSCAMLSMTAANGAPRRCPTPFGERWPNGSTRWRVGRAARSQAPRRRATSNVESANSAGRSTVPGKPSALGSPSTKPLAKRASRVSSSSAMPTGIAARS
jgi:hypothetical protein